MINVCEAKAFMKNVYFKRVYSLIIGGIELILFLIIINGSTFLEPNVQSTFNTTVGENQNHHEFDIKDLRINWKFAGYLSTDCNLPYGFIVFLDSIEAAVKPKPVSTPTPLPTREPTAVPSPTPTIPTEPTPLPLVTEDPENTPIPNKGNVASYPYITRGDKTKKAIALTFDDGYDSKSIQRVLDAAQKYNVKFTFFIIGDALKKYPDLWKRAVQEGHQICNHTNTHKYLTSLSDEGVRNEIDGWEKAVIKVLGDEYLKKMKTDFPYLRLPAGSGYKTERILKIIYEKGYIPIGWSLETYNSVLKHHNLNKESSDAVGQLVENHIVNQMKNGMIVLFHFVVWDTFKFDDILQRLIEKGYTLNLVSELIK